MAPQAVTADARAAEHGALYVEYLVQTRSTWGTRLKADGATEEWSDPGGWQPLVQVSPDEVAGFAALVRDGGFFALPEEIGGAEAPEDAALLTWTVELDGRRHRVAARESSSNRNPVLRDLDAELQRIVGEALNREADAAELNERP